MPRAKVIIEDTNSSDIVNERERERESNKNLMDEYKLLEEKLDSTIRKINNRKKNQN